MVTIDDFCGQKNGYSRSITLRNKLIPIGKTQENLDKLNLLDNDKKRADSYKQVKDLIDDFHRSFIQDVLSKVSFEWGSLFDQLDAYQKCNDKQKKKDEKKTLEIFQKAARKRISEAFSDNPNYDKLFKDGLFKELLPEFIKTAKPEEITDKQDALKVFDKFSTYFTGFHENRKNMYSEEEKSTAISFRIVNENFPKFYANVKLFEKLQKEFPNIIEETEKSLASYLNGKTLKDIFNPEAFNQVLTQSGIDFYNTVIGGVAGEAGSEKIQGLNEKINLARQQLPDAEKNKLRGKMVVLFKQILSDRETASFIPVGFENNDEVYKTLQEFKKSTVEKSIEIIRETFKSPENFDLSKIYVPAKELTAFSLSVFGRWNILSDGLFAIVEEKSKKALSEKQTEKLANEIAKKDYSLSELQAAYEKYLEKNPVEDEGRCRRLSAKNYFELIELRKIDDSAEKEFVNVLSNLDELWSKIDFENPRNLQQEKEAATPIKNYLDEVQNLYHFLKLVDYRGEEEKDSEFYSKLTEILDLLSEIVPLYNKVRNFVTKKPGEVKKIKLNFDCSSFLKGWGTEFGTKDAFIFIDEKKYYLGVINKKLDSDTVKYLQTPGEHIIKQVFVNFQKPDFKNFPRLFIRSKKDRFAPAVEQFNLPVNDILDIYDKGLYKTEYRKENPIIYKESLIKMIDYFKLGISQHESFKGFKLTWKESSEYENISDFYADVTASCYQVNFTNVNFDRLLSLANEIEDDNKKIFLFEIYNKDFSTGKNGGNGSTGKKNLHTMYFENLFSKENLKDIVLKLSGEAEIFLKSENTELKKIVHKQGTTLVNRTTKDKKLIPENIYQEIYQFKNSMIDNISDEAKAWLNSGNVECKIAKFDLIKDKHLIEKSYYLHCSIIQNFKAPEKVFNFNEKVQRYLKDNPDVKIIGLDRGERHLIYLSLINQKGEIELQKTLNLVEQVRNDKTVKVNYQEKLVQKEGDRDKARKNWQTIGNIKELKEGYLSNVVHEIAKLMVEHNAIVVMEELNFGFKRGRFPVERQVYQKFENMLIGKLNYLVFKDKSVTEPGGVLNAYQLTDKSTNVSDVGKQCGWLFYVPAAYTSKIDPKTGFANLLNMKDLTNVAKKRMFFSKFKDIHFDSGSNDFAFTFDYKDFDGKGAAEMTQTEWTVWSNGKRIFYNSKHHSTEEINVSEKLKELFDASKIDYKTENNIFESIMEVGADLKEGEKPSKEIANFWDSLLWYFKLILQMRNSIPNSETDYLISPVKAEDGTFFDSRVQKELGKDSKLPIDADANGAYHIALKGLYLLKNDFNLNDKGYIENISNAEWFRFVQERDYLN